MKKRQSILLVDHGSRRAEANHSLEQMAALIGDQVGPDVFVTFAHMEIAQPTIAEGYAACVESGAEEVIVHPYMLAPGRHATEDIPRLVKDAATQHAQVAYRMTEPLGVHELLGQVVLDRCGIPTRKLPTPASGSLS